MELGNASQVASAVFSFIMLIFVISIHRSKAASDRVSKLESKTEELEGRTSKLEGTVEHLPDQASFHNMQISFEKMQGAMAVMAAEFKPIAATNNRLQEFLLNQAEMTKPTRRRRNP